MRGRRSGGFRALLWLAVLAVLLLPVLAGIAPGLDAAALGGILREARQWQLLANSLEIACGAAAGALLLGAPAGYLLARRKVPWRGLLVAALALPLLIPNYVAAIAWVEALGAQGLLARLLGREGGLLPLYTPGGAALVYALTHFPIPAFCIGAAARGLDGRIEAAARMDYGRRGAFLRVTLPLLLPAGLAGGALVWLIALLGFTVPSLLQVQCYPVEIYTEFSGFYDYAAAGAQALPLVLFGAAGLCALGVAARRGAAGLSPQPHSPGDGVSFAAFGYCAVLALVASGLPLGVLVADAWPLSSLWTVWQSAWQELATSLLLASATATAAVATAVLLVRLRVRGLALIAAAPFLISGPVLGIGLIRLWNHPGPTGWVYDSFGILLIACFARYFVFACIATRAVLSRIDPALEEAAATVGAGAHRRFFTVTFPLGLPGLIGAWTLLFILTLGELDAVVLVTPPGWTPLSVRLFSLMHYGPGPLVAALSLLAAFAALAVAGVCAGAAVRFYRCNRREC